MNMLVGGMMFYLKNEDFSFCFFVVEILSALWFTFLTTQWE